MSVSGTVVAESRYGERLRLQGSCSSRPAFSSTHRPARVFLCATCLRSRFKPVDRCQSLRPNASMHRGASDEIHR
jgi:hypothetical protein